MREWRNSAIACISVLQNDIIIINDNWGPGDPYVRDTHEIRGASGILMV